MSALAVEGQRVRAVRFAVTPGSPVDDNTTVPPGTEGTVERVSPPSMVTPNGQLWVLWDNGSRLALLPGLDQWEDVT